MDEATLATNHNEAWSLACHKQTESNMARCYLQLRELAKLFVDGNATDADRENITLIVRANDL